MRPPHFDFGAGGSSRTGPLVEILAYPVPPVIGCGQLKGGLQRLPSGYRDLENFFARACELDRCATPVRRSADLASDQSSNGRAKARF